MIKIMLVDDQTLVREGIKSLLSLSNKLHVVGEAADGKDAIDNILSIAPDVVLMDIRMPIMSGIQAMRELQQRAITLPVIMLTTFDDHHLLIEAIQFGARGYLLKDVSLETLVECIETVHRGDTLIQPAITEKVLQGLKGKPNEFESLQEPTSLSEKELEVLRLIAAGCSNKEISQSMHKSAGTVKNQVSNVLSKLGVRDRTRAVLKAIELGII